MVKCPKCDADLRGARDRCPTCGNDIGAPNVRQAGTIEELDAVGARYLAQVDDARARGAAAQADLFESAVKRSVAVVNCNIETLKELAAQPKSMYGNYDQGIRAGVRKVAEEVNDRHRASVAALLFGSAAEGIVYGALSLECRGLESYGAYCMQLRDIAVSDRSSVLEENSFVFVETHDLRPGRPIPAGYRAPWPNRHLLACAKLLPRIEATTNDAEFQGILLRSSGDRATDDFLEVRVVSMGRRNTQLRPTFIENKI
jgi:hypothetical protein